MDFLKKKPLDYNETLSPDENHMRPESARSTPITWEAAKQETDNELQRARRLVETLEMLTRHFETKIQAGDPWPGEE
jgi:hypothetical protein